MDAPAPTLVKDCKLAGYSPMIHPTESRSIAIGEMRRMASFPDDFFFAGKYFDAHSRIGNSVPPLFMRAIARHIRDHLL
jgi:DNA (cytosine-5)-methyltransferase 1